MEKEKIFAETVKVEQIKFVSRNIDWNLVEDELRDYIGKSYEIKQTGETIHIERDFVDEFSHSMDGQKLVGANKKAKANMVTVIDKLIENATNRTEYPDYEGKHGKKASNGWHRYDVRFALPVYSNEGMIVGFKNYISRMAVRCDEKGDMYLYDFLRTKKEK